MHLVAPRAAWRRLSYVKSRNPADSRHSLYTLQQLGEHLVGVEVLQAQCKASGAGIGLLAKNLLNLHCLSPIGFGA